MAIQQKRSSTAGAVPTAVDLVLGEIAVNTADGLAFIKKTNGAIVTLGSSAGAAGVSMIDGGFPSDTYSNITVIDGDIP